MSNLIGISSLLETGNIPNILRSSAKTYSHVGFAVTWRPYTYNGNLNSNIML